MEADPPPPGAGRAPGGAGGAAADDVSVPGAMGEAYKMQLERLAAGGRGAGGEAGETLGDKVGSSCFRCGERLPGCMPGLCARFRKVPACLCGLLLQPDPHSAFELEAMTRKTPVIRGPATAAADLPLSILCRSLAPSWETPGTRRAPESWPSEPLTI
jgi:hypothetical protein